MEIRKFIKESLEVIKKRAYENQIQGGFFNALCEMLKSLENIANEYLQKDDTIFEEISDLKKILCGHK